MQHRLRLSLILCIFSLFSLKAQLGFAVAKCKIGSSLDYALVINEGYETEYKAKQELKSRGFKRVYHLNGGDRRGHNLEEGFYVVIRAERKNYKGKKIVSYGLGASAESLQKAQERAISHLKQYDWAWKEVHGFTVVEQGEF